MFANQYPEFPHWLIGYAMGAAVGFTAGWLTLLFLLWVGGLMM